MDFYSVKEAARRLQFTETHIRTLIREGKLPAFSVPREHGDSGYVIPRKSLDSYRAPQWYREYLEKKKKKEKAASHGRAGLTRKVVIQTNPPVSAQSARP